MKGHKKYLLSLPKPLWLKVQSHAKSEYTSIAWVIREALKYYFDKIKKKDKK